MAFTPTREILEGVDHVNIVVRDLDKMARFYAEVVGLTPRQKSTIEGPWLDSVTGLGGVLADVVFLHGPAGSNVELIRYRNPEGHTPSGLSIPNTQGIRHIAFRVSGLEGWLERCKEKGVKLLSGIQEVPTAQMRFGGSKRKRIFYFHDPEGNLLEFCSYE